MLHPLQIGSVNLESNIFIAPLAGYTNLPTRKIFRQQGAGIAYAEMVSADGLYYNRQKSVRLIDSDADDTPLGVQLFGSNHEKILKAYKTIENEKFDIIDINCGCSVRKIVNASCGAYLLKDPDELYKIVSVLKAETDRPVTIKIRSGYDHSTINYLEIYQAAASAGASLITLHPRTKSMLFTGLSDWNHIKELKKKSSIPVIGNGDIFTADDAVRMFIETECDGIMLARGIIENPFLVEEIIARLKGEQYIQKNIFQKLEKAKEHALSLVEYIGDEGRAMIEFRKLFKGYAHGSPDITHLRQAVNETASYNVFCNLIDVYLKQTQT